MIERMYAGRHACALLSVLIDDCVANGRELQLPEVPLQTTASSRWSGSGASRTA